MGELSAAATLDRGRTYCMQWEVSQGSGDTVAMEVTVPDNIVSFGGSVDAAASSFTLEGSWIGRAGGNAKVELYDNAACSGAPRWPVSRCVGCTERSKTSPYFYRRLYQGPDLLARLSLGLVSRTAVLGELEFAHIESVASA